MNPSFYVFCVTRSGIEPRPPAPRVDTVTTRLMRAVSYYRSHATVLGRQYNYLATPLYDRVIRVMAHLSHYNIQCFKLSTIHAFKRPCKSLQLALFLLMGCLLHMKASSSSFSSRLAVVKVGSVCRFGWTDTPGCHPGRLLTFLRPLFWISPLSGTVVLGGFVPDIVLYTGLRWR